MSEINTRELIKLASKGLLYPENHPFHNKEEIEIKLLTASSEDLLTSKSLIKSGNLLNILTKEVLIDKTVDINSLLVGDRDAIIIYTRLFSFGTDYKAVANCKYCGTNGEYTFDLSNVPIKYLEHNPIKEGENLFAFTNSANTVRIQFRLMTVQISDDIKKDLEGKEKFNKKHGNFNSIENNVTTLYRHIIKSINENEDPKYINEYINNMPMKESIEFKKYIKEINPTIEFKSDFYCMNCGEQNLEVALDFNANFFWTDF